MIRTRLWLMSALFVCASAQAQNGEWRTVYTVQAVTVEAADTDTGFDRHRGTVALCGSLEDVVGFAGAVEGYPDWVAHTLESRRIEQSPERTVFYLRNSAPWPMRPRDMVYELIPEFIDDHRVRVLMNGIPDALPPEAGVVRMELAEGSWLFRADDAGELEVQLSLYILPGRAPKGFANRRFAHMIGDTLAALAERFPCSTAMDAVR